MEDQKENSVLDNMFLKIGKSRESGKIEVKIIKSFFYNYRRCSTWQNVNLTPGSIPRRSSSDS